MSEITTAENQGEFRRGRRVTPRAGLQRALPLLVVWAALLQPAAAADYVIHISVDGLNAGELQTLIDSDTLGDFDNFKRLIEEGASTFNARTDTDYSDTLPNHSSMVTGRPALKPAGAASNIQHGYTSNGEPGSNTLHNQHPDWPAVYVASSFDVAHDNGLSTALYASKTKFVLFDQSYDTTNGAPDATPPDDGSDKIDVAVNKSTGSPENASNMQADLLANLAASPTNYSFVHYRDPDTAGHASGWGSSAYDDAVRNVDGYLGDLLALIESDPTLAGRTAVIVTTDHGGTGTGHGTASDPANYTIPFFVWGAGVAAGADLYALNTATRLDPGTGRPDYDAAPQPIRNGDSGNLALHLFGLGPIPGSTINANQDLAVASASAFFEDFESGFTTGLTIGAHPDWFDAGAGPVVTPGIGVAGGIGLAPGTDVFTWTAHPFAWNASGFVSAEFSMDFQTDAGGQFDDDRIGWMITDASADSSKLFGVQLDPGGTGPSGLDIEGYWDGPASADLRPSIVDVPVLAASTWYRLTAIITKLGATAARIDVELLELDGSGAPVGVPVAMGSIPDTSALGADAPDSKYFSAGAMWPAYKNFTAVQGAADNAYAAVGVAQHTLTVSIDGEGSVLRNPDKPFYDPGESVELTAIPDAGEAFLGWSGDLTGTTNPESLIVSGDRAVTASFTGGVEAGDVIIAGFQSWNNPSGQDPGEFVELFNTTAKPISLESLELISRVDNNSDGVVDVDWTLAGASPALAGKVIPPYGFFLIAESAVTAVAGLHDVEVAMDLATGEGGVAERAISLELIVDGVHMDYVLYGRHDGVAPVGSTNPPGDVAFGGSFPRDEVIRNTRGTNSFQEGAIRRLASADLFAGHGVLGFYTDEAALGSGNPAGVWTSPHSETNGAYTARNSGSAPVLPSGVSSSDYAGGATTWRAFDAIAFPSTLYPGPDGEGDAWFEPDFDAAAWPTGSGLFGYGDLAGRTPDTLLASGNITYLFRTSFSVTSLPDFLTAYVLRDDSFALYLNGVEVQRDNLTGPLNANTFSDSTIGGPDEGAFHAFALDPADLVYGSNTLAVEVHNRDQTSTDIGFELRLVGTGTFAAAVCGNGALEFGEACDDGNTLPGDCCSAACGFEAAATLCRAAADVCDVAEACSGDSATCPADAVEPVSSVCRVAADVCDVAETCDGSAAACPADVALPASTLCRAAAGVCDVAETCDGASTVCPTDALEPATSVCRAADGQCDTAENCTGSNPACPPDVVLDGVSCSDSDACNGDETCSAGVCLPTAPPDCDDADPCTADSCDADLGCGHDPIAFCGATGVPAVSGRGQALLAGLLLAAAARGGAGRRRGGRVRARAETRA